MLRKCLAVAVLFFVAFGSSSLAQENKENIECQFDVIVQVDDWLSKLSDKFYGDMLAYPVIAQATNAKSAVDKTYANIENVDLIEPGWKLCLVGVPTAEKMLGYKLKNAPVVDTTPVNLNGPVVVGAAQALSGPLAGQGASIQNGINLAVQEVNQNQYLGRGQLQIIWADTAGNEAEAVTAFEKLIKQDKVVAILGPTLSSSAFAADPLAQAAGVPVIGSSNIVPGITAIGDYIFRTSMAESAVISNTVQLAAQYKPMRQVVVVYDNVNALTRNSAAEFERALTNQGIKILAMVPFETGSPDFSGQLAQLQNLNADAIVLAALSADAAKIISQARQFGVPQNIPFIGADSFNAPSFFQVGQVAVDGVLAGAAWNITNNTGSNRRFVTSYQAQYGSPPDQLAAQAYTAVLALATALRRADSTDRAAVREALAKTEFIDTPLGLFSFDKNREPVHPVVLQIVQAGALVTVQPTPTAP